MSKPNAVTATVVPYTTPPPFLRGAPVRELRVLLAQEARRRLGLGGFQMPASAPVVGMLNAAAHAGLRGRSSAG
jgi:hypothetical protein